MSSIARFWIVTTDSRLKQPLLSSTAVAVAYERTPASASRPGHHKPMQTEETTYTGLYVGFLPTFKPLLAFGWSITS
jgi:hypothetical protein